MAQFSNEIQAVSAHYLFIPYVRDAPEIARDYNQKMGGVGDCDRQRAFFSTKRRSSKWWFPLFTLSLDSAINNAWMIYKRHNCTDGRKKDGCEIKTRRNFIDALMRELVDEAVKRPYGEALLRKL